METFLNEEYLGTEDIVAIGNKTDDLDLRILCATVLVLRATGAKCVVISRQRPLWESQELWSPPTVTTVLKMVLQISTQIGVPRSPFIRKLTRTWFP